MESNKVVEDPVFFFFLFLHRSFRTVTVLGAVAILRVIAVFRFVVAVLGLVIFVQIVVILIIITVFRGIIAPGVVAILGLVVVFRVVIAILWLIVIFRVVIPLLRLIVSIRRKVSIFRMIPILRIFRIPGIVLILQAIIMVGSPPCLGIPVYRLLRSGSITALGPIALLGFIIFFPTVFLLFFCQKASSSALQELPPRLVPVRTHTHKQRPSSFSSGDGRSSFCRSSR